MDNIKVFARPKLSRNVSSLVRLEEKKICIGMPPASVASVENCNSGQKFEFVFDRVFGLESLPGEVFDVAARDVVRGFLEGCNGSIIAYGETGSGKTDTIEGQG